MALTPECHIDVRHLRLMLEGRYKDVELRNMDVPLMRELRRQQTVGVAAIGRRLAQSTELHDVLDAIWAKAPVAVKAKAVQEAAGEAEQKAARKLGVYPAAVALAAQRRFGRSLTSERDRRVLERPPGESPRRVQAVRGHVTRTLIGELVPLIEGAKPRRQRS